MRIKDTGFNLTPPADFYREKRSRAEEPPSAAATAGASFSGALRRAEKTPAAGRTDKIEISAHKEEENSLPPEKIGENIRRELSGGADPARLDSLRRSIAAGEYSVDAGELARVLLAGM